MDIFNPAHCLVPPGTTPGAKFPLRIEQSGFGITTVYHPESLKHHSPKIKKTLPVTLSLDLPLLSCTHGQYKSKVLPYCFNVLTALYIIIKKQESNFYQLLFNHYKCSTVHKY